MNRRRDEQTTKVVAARLPHPLYLKLKERCEQEQRTQSNMIAVLLDEALQATAKATKQQAGTQG